MLEPKKSPYFDKPTQVCLTSLRAMALFYLIRNYEYAYGYTRQGKLYFDDPFPDALKSSTPEDPAGSTPAKTVITRRQKF